MSSNSSVLPVEGGFWPAFGLLAVLALLPVGQGSEAPWMICAIAGLVLAWRQRASLFDHSGLRLALSLFACYWLAALLSAPAAVDPRKSWSTVAAALRFAPFAAFACLALYRASTWPRIYSAAAAIVTLWLLDAWVQILTGYSLGGAMSSNRLTGIFGTNLKLGPVLAVLSPFIYAAAIQRLGWRGLVLAFVFQLMPILIAGSRSAWLMYALVTLVFVWRQTRNPRRFALWSAGALCVAAVAIGVAWRDSGAFDVRLQRTLEAFNGTEHGLNFATSGRLSIWGTALRMSAAHPLTGVGVRGFRYAYPEFARPGDHFVNTVTDEGAFHAHQIVLEVLSETGIIGLMLWLVGAYLAIRAWRRASPMARARALPPALALAVMTFPLNTHLAFYAAWWGLLFWWLLALYCTSLGAEPDHGA